MRFPTAALVALVTASGVFVGCGGATDECAEGCEPGFVCYFGTCVPGDPDAGDASGDADTAADVPPDATDTTDRPETPADVPADVPPDVPVDVPADVPADTGPDVPPTCVPIGHDEDGDGVDDGCDICPSYSNPGQPNADGDRIGDHCEAPADPGLLGSIEAFDAFVPATTPSAAWIDMGSGWFPAPDVLAGSSAPYGIVRTLDIPLSAPYSVETTFAYATAPGGGEAYAGVVFALRADPTGTSQFWWTCLFEWRSRTISIWRYDGGGTVRFVAGSEAVEPTSRDRSRLRRVRVVFDGTTIRCRFDNQDGDSGEVTATRGTGDDLEGRGGLRVYNEAAEFHAFVLYR